MLHLLEDVVLLAEEQANSARTPETPPPMNQCRKAMPANVAPSASPASGISITGGDSCDRMIAMAVIRRGRARASSCASAGSQAAQSPRRPKKVMNRSRQE